MAILLKDLIKPSLSFKKDINIYLYIGSFIIFLVSLYFSKLKSFQNKIMALTIAEIPPILGMAYCFILGKIDFLYKAVFVSFLVMVYIIFKKEKKIEN